MRALEAKLTIYRNDSEITHVNSSGRMRSVSALGAPTIGPPGPAVTPSGYEPEAYPRCAVVRPLLTGAAASLGSIGSNTMSRLAPHCNVSCSRLPEGHVAPGGLRLPAMLLRAGSSGPATSVRWHGGWPTAVIRRSPRRGARPPSRRG